MKNLIFSIVALVTLCVSTAVASDQHVFAPNRPPDYVTRSQDVQPNVWDTGLVGGSTANGNTYPIATKAIVNAPGDPNPIVGLVYRQKLVYKYVGNVSMSPSVPTQPNGSPSFANVGTNSWNAYWLAHDPHGIGGPGSNTPDVPFTAWPFNGQSAGGGGGITTLAPGQSALLQDSPGAVVTFQENVGSAYPYMTYRSEDIEPFKEIDGYRGNRPIHYIWFTPASDPSWSWSYWNPPPGAWWDHVMSYGGSTVLYMELQVWEIRANDPPLMVPAY